jgi:tRNA A-37 threonylcarbamoyl transferase component Bud32
LRNDVRGCLAEDAILSFVAGSVTGPARRAVESHLASCGECRALVSELARRSTGFRTAGTAFAVTLPAQVSPAQPIPVSPGDVVAGKYEVEWTIGAGGMGVVVAAMHRVLGQRVAIKFPSEAIRGSAEGRERMLREARACVRLRSEQTVRVLDVGTLDDGAPFIVMEYLLGRSLAERLREEGPLPVGDAVDTIRQACAAHDEAHAIGIVHRDLKPSNLLETRRFDGTRLVKVVDFGIAKGPALASDGGELTTTRGVMGSPAYMAPEQLRSTRDVDSRADIWALGVTLHELLTGAFDGRPAPRVQSPGLAAVIARCLEHDPSRRFASVRELSAALAPLVSGQAVTRPPPPPARPVAQGGGAGGGAAAAGAGVATWVVRSRVPVTVAPPASASPVPAATAEASVSSAPAAAPPASSAAPAPSASSLAVAGAGAGSTSRPLPRMLPSKATAAPAASVAPTPSAPPAVDPHGLSDRK